MKYNKNLKSIYIELVDAKLMEWKTGIYGSEKKDVTKNLYITEKNQYLTQIQSFYDLYISILNEFNDCTIPKIILKEVLKNEQNKFSPINNKLNNNIQGV